ncbi:butyrophilin subfamily 1 member A1-like isoform X5 [Triplophysa dalaica]|uniref:butyrophilin subfamily 1 member A1-like isoform X5 n=1 Tax=Triplophysa dalaica TaxID=1582913 RepID=UPI0024E02125|nr:butyrophilin subfamily 1 member A1-like isoform X5 [Triplophysa dalaica]
MESACKYYKVSSTMDKSVRRFVCVALIVFGFTRSAELNHLVGPTHPLFVVAGDDAILPCYIKPNTSAVDMRVEWFKLDQQDSVVHLYEARENQTTEQSQSYRGRTSLFQPELQKGNASLRLSTVQVTDNGTYKCFIQSESWYDDITVDIIVEDQMFNVWRTSVILISIMVVFSVLAAIVVATFVYRRRGHCNQKIHGEITRIQKYAVDVTLDPDTAHRCLILSEDGRHVRSGEKRQNVPDNPERFDKCGNVLGKEGFSYRRFYFEVIVKGKTEWDLGVAKESITRKEKVALSPQNGYWTVCLRNGDNYSACAGPNVSLSLRVKPQKVGVFVDYEEGLVSFYDVESRSHIYSFTGQSFTEKLYPFLNPCTNVKYRYSAPLRISSVDCQSKLLP